MKALIVLFYIFYGTAAFASKNSQEYRLNAMESIQAFSFKEVLDDPKKFEELVADTILIVDVKNRVDFVSLVDRSTKGLFIHSFILSSPLTLEFFHQLINTPKAVASFLKILLMRNSLFIFSLLIILSLILSHYLGEKKYKYQAMSGKRLGYALFRFSLVNGFRLAAFFYLFAENIKPITQVYMASVDQVKHIYPLLYKATALISNATSYLI